MSYVTTTNQDNLWPEVLYSDHDLNLFRKSEYIEVEKESLKTDPGVRFFTGLVFGVVFSVLIWIPIITLVSWLI